MLATVPLKVIVASAVPSPAAKLRPVIRLRLIVPPVALSVRESGSAAPLL